MGCVFFLFFFQFFYRSSSALHRRSSTLILPDYWGTFCAGVCPKSIFLFLVAAGFEPTSLSLRSGRFNRYTMLTPHGYVVAMVGVGCGSQGEGHTIRYTITTLRK